MSDPSKTDETGRKRLSVREDSIKDVVVSEAEEGTEEEGIAGTSSGGSLTVTPQPPDPGLFSPGRGSQKK